MSTVRALLDILQVPTNPLDALTYWFPKVSDVQIAEVWRAGETAWIDEENDPKTKISRSVAIWKT